MNTSLLYIPFGAGPRSCLGRSLALLSIKAFMINLMTTYSQISLPLNYEYILGFNKSVNPVN